MTAQLSAAERASMMVVPLVASMVERLVDEWDETKERVLVDWWAAGLELTQVAYLVEQSAAAKVVTKVGLMVVWWVALMDETTVVVTVALMAVM